MKTITCPICHGAGCGLCARNGFITTVRNSEAMTSLLSALKAAEATVETVCVRAFKYGGKDVDAERTLSDIRLAIAKAEGRS